jgi:hypothetical protein
VDRVHLLPTFPVLSTAIAAGITIGKEKANGWYTKIRSTQNALKAKIIPAGIISHQSV